MNTLSLNNWIMAELAYEMASATLRAKFPGESRKPMLDDIRKGVGVAVGFNRLFDRATVDEAGEVINYQPTGKPFGLRPEYFDRLAQRSDLAVELSDKIDPVKLKLAASAVYAVRSGKRDAFELEDDSPMEMSDALRNFLVDRIVFNTRICMSLINHARRGVVNTAANMEFADIGKVLEADVRVAREYSTVDEEQSEASIDSTEAWDIKALIREQTTELDWNDFEQFTQARNIVQGCIAKLDDNGNDILRDAVQRSREETREYIAARRNDADPYGLTGKKAEVSA